MLRVSGITVAQTVFSLQIAGVKPSESRAIEALLLVIVKTVGTKTVMTLLNNERNPQPIVFVIHNIGSAFSTHKLTRLTR